MNGHVSNCLAALRGERSMTQQQLAEQVGVSRQTINAIEGKKYSPSLEMAFSMAAVLGVPLEEVFQFVPANKGKRRA